MATILGGSKVIFWWSNGTWIEKDKYTSDGYGWKGSYFEVCVSENATDSEIDADVRMICNE